MKLKTIRYVAATAMAVGLAYCASAQFTAWTAGDNTSDWTDPGNWSAGVPTNTAGMGVAIDPQTGPAPILPAGYSCDIGSLSDNSSTFGTLWGPEWGTSLTVLGELDWDWMMAPVQNYWPNGRTEIYLRGSGILKCVGNYGATAAIPAGIGIGYAWWWFADAPYVTMNMYDNAQLIVPNIGLGGHLNIYDTAVAYVGLDVFTGNPLMGSTPGLISGNPGQGASGMSVVLGTGNQGTTACSDLTASLNLGGGSIVLPFAYTNETAEPGNTIYDLVNRGVIRFYGKGFDTNADGTLKDATITYNANNTFDTNILSTNIITVTPVPLGTLSQIYFQPLFGSPANTLSVGTIQQAQLVGDYPPVTGVLLSSPEPGLDLHGTIPTYSSSNPSVLTVDANGIVTAVSAGSANLTASYGGHNSPALTVNVVPVTPTLVHRYSFSESSGTTAHDSIGTANGTLNGTAAFNGQGQVVLDGTVGSSVSLPSGILANMDEVSIEVWATFPGAINPYANLFAFGNTDLVPLDPNNGDGYDYITCSPHTGASPNTVQANFGQGNPGFDGEFANDVVWTGVLDNQTNVQVVAVWHPLAASSALYTNGVLLASGILFNDMTDPVAYKHNGSIINYQIHGGLTNYIGQSLYTGDPGLLANIDEFRIYNGPLTAAQVAADNALGPNQLRGTSTSVSLSASVSGGNVVLSWPTTSALVTLMSSPVLGPGAVWTPVSTASLVVVSGKYQITVPATGTAFFRLQL